jgi:predicted TIM-barrel fold metal-dependent hydrolase
MPGDLAWLARVQEDVLEPERAICDPHHHLWDRRDDRYLLGDLIADFGGHRVVSTVFVECAAFYRAGGDEALRFVGETEFANGVAAMCASGRYGELRACAGIVSRADLTRGDDVARLLDAHLAASPVRFRGIRHAAAFDAHPAIPRSHTAPPAGLLGDAAFRRGFGEVARRGLVFDAWLYHHQLPELTALARAFPDATIVLDHHAGPLGIGPYAGKRAEILAQWTRDLAELARCENVVAKLGGILMDRNGWGFDAREFPPGSEEVAAATREWHLHAIDCFGPGRCMFESNFPMDRVSCSYQVLWNSFKRIAGSFSEAEKSALFHDTAVRVYRIGG